MHTNRLADEGNRKGVRLQFKLLRLKAGECREGTEEPSEWFVHELEIRTQAT